MATQKGSLSEWRVHTENASQEGSDRDLNKGKRKSETLKGKRSLPAFQTDIHI